MPCMSAEFSVKDQFCLKCSGGGDDAFWEVEGSGMLLTIVFKNFWVTYLVSISYSQNTIRLNKSLNPTNTQYCYHHGLRFAVDQEDVPSQYGMVHWYSSYTSRL